MHTNAQMRTHTHSRGVNDKTPAHSMSHLQPPPQLLVRSSLFAPFQFSGMRAGERARIELNDQASGKRVLLATNVQPRGGGAGGPWPETVEQERMRLFLRVTFVSPPLKRTYFRARALTLCVVSLGQFPTTFAVCARACLCVCVRANVMLACA